MYLTTLLSAQKAPRLRIWPTADLLPHPPLLHASGVAHRVRSTKLELCSAPETASDPRPPPARPRCPAHCASTAPFPGPSASACRIQRASMSARTAGFPGAGRRACASWSRRGGSMGSSPRRALVHFHFLLGSVEIHIPGVMRLRRLSRCGSVTSLGDMCSDMVAPALCGSRVGNVE